MKKISIYAMCAMSAAVVAAGCAREEDDIFKQSAAERLNEVKVAYTEYISDSKGGWIMEYFPTADTYAYNEDDNVAGGMGYQIAVDFKTDGSVLVGMDNAFTGDRHDGEDSRTFSGEGGYEEQSSLWEVLTDDGPVLSFNTFNSLFHIFSDPRQYSLPDLGYGNASSGSQGVGVGGDYEFIIIDCKKNAQQVMLKGKKRGTYARLTRLPEGTDFKAYLADLKAFQQSIFAKNAPNFFVLTVDGDRYKTSDIFSTIVNLYPYNGNELQDETYHPFLITKRDGKYYLRFRDTFTWAVGDEKKVYKLQELVFDEENHRFVDVDNSKNTLTPPTPFSFAFESMAESHKWKFSSGTSKSAAFKTLYDAVSAKFKATKSGGKALTLNDMSLAQVSADTLALDVTYRATATSTVRYWFSLNRADEQFTVSYLGGATAGADNLLKTITPLSDMLKAMEGTWSVSINNSWYNLNSLVFTSADESLWFSANYTK